VPLTTDSFPISIYNQLGVVFEGTVKAIACGNAQGEFSVLPGHTNFISMITKPVVAFLVSGETKTFPVGLGVIRVLDNKAELYIGLHLDKQTELLAKRLEQPTADVTRLPSFLEQFGQQADTLPQTSPPAPASVK
jgi:ATP synthase, Delta/Epsilon chain, beta-sandwich domain